ncbi:hypothetical protein OEZ86_009807 [Tetradesmus obliquus]|uniref:Secreted protein n=1 Tax=Tetradesmus obliquus TaxID=3088 RepID=A0ABY8URD5_TETOB|nr:hypothetical protein OEZ85_001248 [Tetradesmus obliquus]WIA43308.1 hypothetical protein OEZ86_009807 [Tetradesmus obliquus]
MRCLKSKGLTAGVGAEVLRWFVLRASTPPRDSCRSNDSSSYGSYCSGSRAHMRQKQPTKQQPEEQPQEQR